MTENAKSRSGIGWLGLFLVLLLTPRIWLAFIPETYNNKEWNPTFGHSMRQMVCHANIRAIMGAIESYNMDNNEKIMQVNSEADLQPLFDHGYLKGEIPRCSRRYSEVHPYLAFWLGWERIGVEMPDSYEGLNLTTGELLRCKRHGTVKDVAPMLD